jgi:hypothetical protein
MGRSIKPKYRAVVKFEGNRCPITICWHCKEDGSPTNANAIRWLKVYNESLLPGGANAHIPIFGIDGNAISIKVETNERYPETVAMGAL